MATQSSQDEKVRHATRVIENNGTPEELYAQLDVLWNELTGAA
jgi:dephospho-CoA kinase